MALIDNYNLSQNELFRHTVEAAMSFAATNVGSEAINQSYLPYHQKRITLASAILNGPQNYVIPFAVACAGRGTLTVLSSDNDIQFTVNSVFDTIAGVRSDEKPI